ncbi:MAG: G-D-S-L family lipolytic protein [Cyclobacteriaceae bacterium]|nr:G-D-S-L family lipolytic protein [Cyclobacteriaceae bacterium]
MIRSVLTPVFIFLSLALAGQDPLRFEKEVNDLIVADSAVNQKRLILFTGSSSVRLWHNLEESFPQHNVLNRGFGGSEMSDLVYYASQLILKHKPGLIFIYEGDNDINAGRSTEQILANADLLVKRIRAKMPKAKIVFISPKPSGSRWHLKAQYEDFNAQLKQWTKSQKRIYFADVWSPMLDASGNLLPGLFLEDDLHMNEKGYAIWTKVLNQFF